MNQWVSKVSLFLVILCGCAGPEPIGRCAQGSVVRGACSFDGIVRRDDNSCGAFGGRETYSVFFRIDEGARVPLHASECFNDTELEAAQDFYRRQRGRCEVRDLGPCPREISSDIPHFEPAR